MKLSITDSHVKQWEEYNHETTRREATCPVANCLKEMYKTDNVRTGTIVSDIDNEKYIKHSVELQAAIAYFDDHGYFAIGDYNAEIVDKKDILFHIS